MCQIGNMPSCSRFSYESFCHVMHNVSLIKGSSLSSSSAWSAVSITSLLSFVVIRLRRRDKSGSIFISLFAAKLFKICKKTSSSRFLEAEAVFGASGVMSGCAHFRGAASFWLSPGVGWDFAVDFEVVVNDLERLGGEEGTLKSMIAIGRHWQDWKIWCGSL